MPRYLVAGFPIGTERVITPVAVIVSVGEVCWRRSSRPWVQRSAHCEEHHWNRQASPGKSRYLSGGSQDPWGSRRDHSDHRHYCGCPVRSRQWAGRVGALAVGLGFVLAPAVPWLLERSERLAIRLGSIPGYIATVELRAAPTRATALAATSAIAVYAIVALGGAANDIRRGAANASQNIAGNAAVLVAPAPFQDEPFPVESFPAAPTIARLRSINAVSHVSALRGSFLDVRRRRLLVIAMPRGDPAPVFPAQIVQGSKRGPRR